MYFLDFNVSTLFCAWFVNILENLQNYQGYQSVNLINYFAKSPSYQKKKEFDSVAQPYSILIILCLLIGLAPNPLKNVSVKTKLSAPLYFTKWPFPAAPLPGRVDVSLEIEVKLRHCFLQVFFSPHSEAMMQLQWQIRNTFIIHKN